MEDGTWLDGEAVDQFIATPGSACPECGEEMEQTDWPGDTWVYRCPNGHVLGVGK